MATISAAALIGEAAAADNYVVIYEGAPSDLEGALKSLTNLSLERRAYPTAAAIRRMGAEDTRAIIRALTAAGYYAAKTTFRIDGDGANGEKLKAVFVIDPGPKFTIRRHIIVYEDAGPDDRPASFEAAGIAVTDGADGASIERNQQKFLSLLWESGYPAARILSRHAEARLDEGTADAIYKFETGPIAKFDGVVVEGAVRTKDDFLTALKTWEEGELFDRAELVTYRDRLSETGLFSSIDVAPGKVNDEGGAPVEVSVVERKRRTIGAGVSFSTSEGPGGRLFLEYRNLLGRGERARASVEGTGVEQSATLDFDKPLPGFPGSAYGKFEFTNETTDAYDARSLEISAGLAKKWFDDRLETRAGVGLETSKVEPKQIATPTVRDERNYFVSIPLSATWDTEDDPLALSKGVRASIFAVPYFGTDQFTRIEATARSRTHFGDNDRFTIAGRMRIAATAGQALRTLPVNKRVFSGGGSSVRGYDYQSVGPLDPNGVPIGGRSAVEAAIEARAIAFGRVQFAAFADAGAVYAGGLPDFTGDYLVGAGVGVRYLSPIGPIRVDVATPLDKRPTDRNFQLYISLGQPF